ncbi:MAG: tetratricopeptide repeat protein [Methylococcaceae bacterium]
MVILLLANNGLQAQPYIPADDDVILEQLPQTLFPSAFVKKIRTLRTALEKEPNNWERAKELSQTYLNLAKRQSDPRYMGYAQAVLSPWWKLKNPPAHALLLRAVILQKQHDFAAAKQDLERVLQQQRDHPQALLTLATIESVQADYQDAIQHCQRLLKQSSLLLSIVCQSIPLSLTGKEKLSYQLLKNVLHESQYLEQQQRVWAWTALAEIAWRMGEPGQAQEHFLIAFKHDENDMYLLRVYADFLLQQNRPEKVVDLIDVETSSDALRLRLALAEKKLHNNSGRLDRYIAQLKARFAANHLRGSALHQGDEARFNLWLLNKPEAALALAKQNWAVQKESSDTYILLQSAQAAGDKKMVLKVKQWLKTKGTHDRLIDQILSSDAVQNNIIF